MHSLHAYAILYVLKITKFTVWNLALTNGATLWNTEEANIDAQLQTINKFYMA